MSAEVMQFKTINVGRDYVINVGRGYIMNDKGRHRAARAAKNVHFWFNYSGERMFFFDDNKFFIFQELLCLD